MQTIIVKLLPGNLENPDLDIRYHLPDAVKEYTNNRIRDNGYDYLDEDDEAGGDALGIWLACENAAEDVKDVIALMKQQRICDNDLSRSAEIYISEKESDDINNCRKIYPQDSF